MREFLAISTIQIDNTSSWWNSIFLTFDVDWAHDSLFAETIDLVELAPINATRFLVTFHC